MSDNLIPNQYEIYEEMEAQEGGQQVSLKRFVHITRVGHIDCNMEEDENGAWALVEDIEEHTAKLTADLEAARQKLDISGGLNFTLTADLIEADKRLEAANKRVAELKETVLTYKHRHESGGPLSEVRPDSCACSACDKARAALATLDSGQGGG